ncbi:GyrI-like domain-containing protein [Leifsonia sp. H3M29-4]|uniref:GyrI-like domain-containing protein n=1 Tax=Salinibacterium metalliresistens TaxID=3031321 RepID=UPI0023DBBE42|nr:GyrI-like domain-containing protein [Salinibacterium metalliresistens]MDF1477628.1 GyrI-like domain-containing protein [Salinibacterium metalliresistens]
MSEPSNNPEIVTLAPTPATLVREVVPMTALSEFFGRAFEASATALERQGIAIAGPPLGVYYGMPTDTVDVGAGFPSASLPTDAEGVTGTMLPGGRAARVVHFGSYDTLSETYGRLMSWLAEEGLTPGPVMWESYLNEPQPDDPTATQTLIVWPLAE